MSFVELPGLLYWNPHAIRLFQHMPQGANSTLQETRVRYIGMQTFLGQELPSFDDFIVAFG